MAPDMGVPYTEGGVRFGALETAPGAGPAAIPRFPLMDCIFACSDMGVGSGLEGIGAGDPAIAEAACCCV